MEDLNNELAIRAFESARFVKYHGQYIRNRCYWRELRKMQKESFGDSKLFIDFLRKKMKQIRQLSDAWKSFCSRDEQELLSLKKSHSSASYHNIGEMACQIIHDAESSSHKQLRDVIDQVEHQVLPQSIEKLQEYEKTVEELGEKGKACIFACMLIEYRVRHYYSLLINQSNQSSSHTHVQEDSSHERDHFVLLVRYYSAVQRQKRLLDQCNLHFRTFFQTAKELEAHRLSLISRIADNYLTKIADTLQKMCLLNKSSIESLKNLPQHLMYSQRAFGEELDRRVRDINPQENGDFDRIALLELQRRFNQSSLTALSLPASSVEPPSMLELLQRSQGSLKRLFVCHFEDVGYIISSWTLVIIVITTAGYLHVVKYPGNGEVLQLPIATLFAKSLDETKFCFEEDICSPRLTAISTFTPNTSQQGSVTTGNGVSVHHSTNATHISASPRPGTGVVRSVSNSNIETSVPQHTGSIKWQNDTWRRLMQQVHISDLDSGHDEEHWQRLIQQHVSRIHINGSEHQMTEDREDLFRILHTYDLRQCTVTLRPSAIPSENVIEIVETVVDNSSFFVFSRTSERRLTLKTRVQQDAIEMVSLIQSSRTSPNIAPVLPNTNGSNKNIDGNATTESPGSNKIASSEGVIVSQTSIQDERIGTENNSPDESLIPHSDNTETFTGQTTSETS